MGFPGQIVPYFPPPTPIRSSLPSTHARSSLPSTPVRSSLPPRYVPCIDYNAAAAAATTAIPWTIRDYQLLIAAAAEIPDGAPDRWLRIAQRMPGRRSPQEVEQHYRWLQQSIQMRQFGTLSPQSIQQEPPATPAGGIANDGGLLSDGGVNQQQQVRPNVSVRASKAWSLEEHRLFLRGLREYGRGHWKAISKNAVKTRTPAQVASHAQKFFLRQESKKTKMCRRTTIHDILD